MCNSVLYSDLLPPAGCWCVQEAGAGYRHRCGLPSQEPLYGVPADQRAEAEGVQVQTHPLPQETEQACQG